jgi:adhesin transport system membrane fusion protein
MSAQPEGRLNHLLMNVGRKLLALLERIRVFIAPVTDRIFGSAATDAETAQAGFRSFEQEAVEVMSRRETQRAQKIVRASVVVMLLLLLWAGLAPVDEVTRGEGRVIPSRQLQVLQSLDGGVVSEILVKEGQVKPVSCC